MATMRQIRNRIRVAGNIAQITGAMEMVAAARLKKAQDRLTASRPYSEGMAELVGSLLGSLGTREPDTLPPLARSREASSHVGLLVITADRGLCGSYNSGVIRLAQQTVGQFGPDRVRLMVVGRRGRLFFRRRGFEMLQGPVEDSSQLEYRDAAALADTFRQAFLAGELDEVHMIYTQFVSPLTQRPTMEQLLPIMSPGTGQAVEAAVEYLSEPPTRQLVETLLPRYVAARIYYAMLESTASEHGARMTSMSAATDNATKMISGLTLALNRARQAAITKEISEIVGGAEALKS